MATKKSSALKVPVRPAPAPPPGRASVLPVSKPSPNLMDSWDMSFDDPFSDAFSKQGSIRSPSAWPDMHNSKKKVPPPRPPPPKITAMNVGKSGSKHIPKLSSKQQPSRPSELLSSLFSRRGTKGEPTSTIPPGPTGINNRSVTPALTTVSSAVATASLIDLSSPPSSPTPTTRSSSDGLSVDSFGSDGTASHSHHHSQVESGFEDDSELFGAFTATPSPVGRDPWGSSSSTPGDVFSPLNTVVTPSKSPWATAPQDPFSPPRKFNASPTPPPAQPVAASVPAPGVMAFKPTIIRPKVKPNSSPSVSRAKSAASPMPSEDGDFRSDSPPMPSIPPPAPPAELLSEIESSLSSGMETLSLKGSKIQGPHCVALYDFEGSHPGDLKFKEGDVIQLVKELSGDWLQGCIGGREGMFPANFVNVVVPLSDLDGVFATALYTFAPETWEDLDLQEGAKVRLLSRVNNDWLYGESNGKRGQFPATFIDNVPINLPMHS